MRKSSKGWEEEIVGALKNRQGGWSGREGVIGGVGDKKLFKIIAEFNYLPYISDLANNFCLS